MKGTKKSFSRTFLVVIVAIGLMLVNVVQFGVVQAATEVSGVISSDATWTQANSPYVVTAPLLVDEGVTLTIEPGVTVYLNDTYMRVSGTLIARGTPTEQILLICNGTGLGFLYPNDNAAVQFTKESTSWNETTGAGSIIENAVVNTTQASHTIYITKTSPKINNCTVTNSGGQRAVYNYYGAAIISNCSISSNFAGISCASSVGSISDPYIGDAQILDNVISGCETGITIYAGSPIVEGNVIANNNIGNKNNGQGGIRIHNNDASPIIYNNTIVGNTVGFNIIDSPSPTIKFNNIHDNIEYNVYLNDYAYSDINATNNWWGTTEVSDINQSIYDKKNDFNLGLVTFVPFLTEPNPEAPEAPEIEPQPTPTPTQLSISVDASSTTVGSAVNIYGKLTDVNGSAVEDKLITLSYSITGDDWVTIGSDTTNATGDYTIQWINTASGTFILKTEWTGNDDYLGASANTTLSFLPYQNQNNFFIESNSTITQLEFNTTNAVLRFTASGPTETTGYMKATIPKELLSAEPGWTVYVDEKQVTPIITEDANNTYIYITYGHSTHTIEIVGTDAIPEYPTTITITVLIIAIVLMVVRKRRQSY